MTSALTDIRNGGCAAWRLPIDPTCPATARSYFRAAATVLTLPADSTDDGEVCVSELATNAHQHAGSAGLYESAAPPELWMYVRTYPKPQLMVTVFDARRERQPEQRRADPLDEHGNGLHIVAALSAACGSHPSRSRLAAWPVLGKAVWFAQDLPWSRPAVPAAMTTGQAARRLHALLAARGLDGIVRRDGSGVSLVSVRNGVNVWVQPGAYSISGLDGSRIRRPLIDLEDTAEIVVCHHERHG